MADRAPPPVPHFEAVVLEPRFGAAWAVAPGATPAGALGAALVACLDEPPWERAADADRPGEIPG